MENDNSNIRPVSFNTLFSLDKPNLVAEMEEPSKLPFINKGIPCSNGMGLGQDTTSTVTKFASSYSYNIPIDDQGLVANPESYI